MGSGEEDQKLRVGRYNIAKNSEDNSATCEKTSKMKLEAHGWSALKIRKSMDTSCGLLIR